MRVYQIVRDNKIFIVQTTDIERMVIETRAQDPGDYSATLIGETLEETTEEKILCVFSRSEDCPIPTMKKGSKRR